MPCVFLNRFAHFLRKRTRASGEEKDQKKKTTVKDIPSLGNLSLSPEYSLPDGVNFLPYKSFTIIAR